MSNKFSVDHVIDALFLMDSEWVTDENEAGDILAEAKMSLSMGAENEIIVEMVPHFRKRNVETNEKFRITVERVNDSV